MLVDPNTGMPVETTDPSTIGGRTVLNAIEGAGYSEQDLPLAYQLAASIPGATTTAAWNMHRVSNTIVKGGRRGTPSRGGLIRGGVPNTFNPRRFTRLGNAGNIDPADRGTYSPFGFMARSGNWAARNATRFAPARAALARVGVDSRTDAFSRGTFGRMAAIARIQSMSGAQFDRRRGTIAQSIQGLGGRRGQIAAGREYIDRSKHAAASVRARQTLINSAPTSGYGSVIRRAALPGPEGFFQAADRAAIVRATHTAGVLDSIGGQISGRTAGFFAGAQEARLGTQASVAALNRLEGPAGAGVRAAGRALSGELGSVARIGARVAGSGGASVAMRAAGPVGAVLLVRDLAMLSGKIAGATTKAMVDVGQNLMSPLNKGIMGNVYHDNAVAATSRQRGVQAIANSRLNMRSVLGNEAAMMHARYG